MFGIFKKVSQVDKLQNKYEKLMNDWHKLSATNRAESDKKYAEAQAILTQMEQLLEKL